MVRRLPALEIIAEVDHHAASRFKTVRPVARFSDTPDSIRLLPSTLGQHIEEILHAICTGVPLECRLNQYLRTPHFRQAAAVQSEST